MTFAAARLAALHPTARTLVVAARMAETAAANDNAGRAWHERDAARHEHDDRHLGTLVTSRAARAIHVAVTDELDPGAWRVYVTRLDGCLAVEFRPVAVRSNATERQERAFRAFVRAAGVGCV